MTGRAVRPAARRYWFFAGKGGVGKTTCAAAAAVARAEAGLRILAVSVDPSHSLGDALARPLSCRPRPVPTRRGALAAVELDADAALARWLEPRRAALERILLRGTYLDEDDVGAVLRLSLPGVDELIGLLELERLAEARPYDEIVVDTAPTGHLLRLLAMPETLGTMAGVLDDMHAKHRYLADSLGGRHAPDASDRVIEELAADGSRLHALLRDRQRCRLSWVLLPEALSLAEAQDGVADLAAAGIEVADLVVNRLTRPRRGCRACRRRSLHERRTTAAARRAIPGLPLRELPALPREPRGPAALRALGARLLGPAVPPHPGARAGAEPAQSVAPGQSPTPRQSPTPGQSLTPRRVGGMPGWLEALVPAGTEVVLFAGKGGVGKTTSAAATALLLAERRRASRVLLMSLDPAHSIADALGAPLGDRPARVPGTALDAREVDARRLFAIRRQRYQRSVERAFDAIRGGSRFDATFDRVVMEQLIDLAPPGLDELLGLLEVLAAVRGRAGLPAYEAVVVDTAPTGHTLRLLRMPEIALQWVHTFMALWLKYRAVIGLGELGEDLVALSRDLRDLAMLLRDPRRTAVVAITRPGHLPTVETRRLVAGVRGLGLRLAGVIVNGVTPQGCAHAAGPGARGEKEAAALLADLRRDGRAAALAGVAAPLEAVPPRGATALARWARTWRRLA